MNKVNSKHSQVKGFKTIADKSCMPSPAESLPNLSTQMQSLFTDVEKSNISLSNPEKGDQKIFARSIKVKRLLGKKRQEIIELQKLVAQQQTLYIKLYAEIKELEARFGVDSGDKLGKVQFLSLKGWLSHDLLLLIKENADAQRPNNIGELGTAVMQQLKNELSSITKDVMDLSNDLMARRLKLIDCFRKRGPEPKQKNDFDTETGQIQKMVRDTCNRLEAKVNQSLELAETSWKDRYNLLTHIDNLNKELSNLQEKLIQDMKKNDAGDKATHGKSDSSNTDLVAKLNKERSARESLKHMVETAEGLLRKARLRITVLERELKNTQKQMQASARKHQEFELLHRCRETSYGVRSKKLLEESKTGGETIEMLTLQRDALELRVKELQEQVKTIIENYEGQNSKYRDNLNRLQEKVDEEGKRRLEAEARAVELEMRVKDVHEEYKQLLEQSDKLVKMSAEQCLDYLPHKENEPTVRETELRNELLAIKAKYEEVTAELRQSREDKETLLNSLAKIAQEGPGNNMGNELLLREQKIFLLQKNIEELKQTIKSRNETLAHKNRQIISLRMEASRADYVRVDAEYCSKDTSKQDLAIELLELTEQVAALTRERESLMKTAVSRTLMLERHERCAELFAQITRARRGMAALLHGQDRSCSQTAFTDVKLSSSLSPMCLKAAKTFSELRSDRERVLQLQDVVASQNLQLKRERRVRNQLEQRRAILERLCLNRTSNNYVPENVAAYLGTSSYMANDFVKSS